MTRVATMGTSSCATIAIQDFKHSEEGFATPIIWNNHYLETLSFEPKGLSVEQFYDRVLYPTAQELGRSDQYPFDALMDAIEDCSLKSKFMIATLNQSQRSLNEGYWEQRLLARGFVLIDVTKNKIGQKCFIYTRSDNRVEF